jgi:hypothetical protein
MTKAELIKAIHDLVHGKDIMYQVVDEDIDDDEELTIFFQGVGEYDD